MTSPEMTAADVLREAGYDVWEPTDEDLDALSHLIGRLKRYGKASKCRNGMTDEPPCRSLQEAISDIRRRAQVRLTLQCRR